MIVYHICATPPTSQSILRLGFSVWARNPPKDYLSIYPQAAKKLQTEEKATGVSLCALVDDVLPRVTLSRTHNEQLSISSQYIKQLPKFGFHEVYLVSDFMKEKVLAECLSYATKITISEFWKLLPQSKKAVLDNLTLAEMLGFLWHIHVLEIAIDKYQLTGLLVGIRSEFFYLTAHKLLPPHDVYFINTY